MQTRFKDLGVLLYESLGVVVLLGAIVIIIMMHLALIAFWKELESEVFLQRKRYRKYIRGTIGL